MLQGTGGITDIVKEILRASGKTTGARVLYDDDPRRLVARLLDAYRKGSVRIYGQDVPVRSTVRVVHGLSAHADADGLMRWLATATRPPRRVFVVHGDPEPASALAARIRAELGWTAVVPRYLDRVVLD